MAGDFPCPDLVHQLPDSLQFVRNRESAAAAAAGRDGHPTAVGRRLVFSARSPQNGVVTRTPRFDLRRGVVESVVLMISRSQQPTRVLVFMVDAPWVTCGGPVADAVERAAVEALLALPNVSAGIDARATGFRVPGPAKWPPSAPPQTPRLAHRTCRDRPRLAASMGLGSRSKPIRDPVTTQVKFRGCDSLWIKDLRENYRCKARCKT